MKRKLATVILVALVWSGLISCSRKQDATTTEVIEIHDAAKAGDLETIKALLKANPDLISSRDTNNCTPLDIAASYDQKVVAKLLLANKADANGKNGLPPLHLVAIANHPDIAELLLDNGADINVKTKNGWTPLHVASAGGRKEMVEWLLAHNADVNAKDKHGMTPYHYAQAHRYTDVAELLRQHGGHE